MTLFAILLWDTLSGTFSVQSANISHPTGTNNVEVTCFFATNSPASACMALFENASFGLSFNGSIPHPPGSLLSFAIVDIPQRVLQQGVMQMLSSVVFDVKVFDVYMNRDITDRPAFEQTEALVVELDEVEPTLVESTRIVGKKCMCQCLISVLPVCLHVCTGFCVGTSAAASPSVPSTTKEDGKYQGCAGGSKCIVQQE